MAKYTCPFCSGFAHVSGGIPNHSEWLLLSAVEHDSLPEMVSSDALYKNTSKLYKCIYCDALAIFWSKTQEAPTWYAPRRESGA